MTLFRHGIKRGMKGVRERVRERRTQEAASVHTRARPTLNGFVRCKIYDPGSGDNYRGSRRCNLIIPGNFASFTSALEIRGPEGGEVVLVAGSAAG